MRIAQYRISFAPGLWPTAAALLMLALTLHLGNWQRARAAEKRILQAEFGTRSAAPPITLDASARDGDRLKYRRARAVGQWRGAGQIFLDNKTDGGSAGFQVITPLQLEGGNVYVLVNRGWIARDRNYPAAPRVAVPAGAVEVTGTISLPTARFLELAATPTDTGVWQNLTIARYRQHSGLDILPFVLLADGIRPRAADALLPVAEQADAGVEKHVEYMLTWYALAATLVVLWIFLNLRVVRLSDSASLPTGKKP